MWTNSEWTGILSSKWVILVFLAVYISQRSCQPDILVDDYVTKMCVMGSLRHFPHGQTCTQFSKAQRVFLWKYSLKYKAQLFLSVTRDFFLFSSAERWEQTFTERSPIQPIYTQLFGCFECVHMWNTTSSFRAEKKDLYQGSNPR